MCFRNPVMKKQKVLRAARTLKSCTDSYVSSTFLSSLCNTKKMVSDWTNFCGRYQHNQLLFVFLRFWFAVWVLYKQCFVNFDEFKVNEALGVILCLKQSGLLILHQLSKSDLSYISPLIPSVYHLCTISLLSFFFLFLRHIMKSIFL